MVTSLPGYYLCLFSGQLVRTREGRVSSIRFVPKSGSSVPGLLPFTYPFFVKRRQVKMWWCPPSFTLVRVCRAFYLRLGVLLKTSKDGRLERSIPSFHRIEQNPRLLRSMRLIPLFECLSLERFCWLIYPLILIPP